MVRASKGFRTGTRRKLKKRFRDKFKQGIFLQEFKPKDKVIIKIEPSSTSGMPSPKLNGRIGEVRAKRGKAYVVGLMVGKKEKQLIVKPEHLKKLGS